jgi:hypothetical protein
MQYITKLQHRARYLGIPNAVLPKHFDDSIGLTGITDPDEMDAISAAADPTIFHQMEFDFKWDLNLTGNILKAKFINVTENNRIINNFSIDMSYLSNADACTLWYIKDDIILSNISKVLAADAEELTIVDTDLVNSFANTLPTKNFNIYGIYGLIVFYVTKDNPTPADIITCIIRPVVSTDTEYNTVLPEMLRNNIQIHPLGDYRVTVTGNLTKHSADPTVLMVLDTLLPEITVTSSTVSGDIVTVNFTTDSKINNIYLVQSEGYLPKSKIPVTNGTGSFKVVTTGMDAGDTIKVKMGFKYWVNRTEFTKTL